MSEGERGERQVASTGREGKADLEEDGDEVEGDGELHVAEDLAEQRQAAGVHDQRGDVWVAAEVQQRDDGGLREVRLLGPHEVEENVQRAVLHEPPAVFVDPVAHAERFDHLREGASGERMGIRG